MNKTKNGDLTKKVMMVGSALVSLTALQPEALAATAKGTASAVVVDAINVSVVTDVKFGDISVPGAGTISLSSGGARTLVGGAIGLVGGGTTAVGVVKVTAATLAALSISVTAATVKLTAGANTLTWTGIDLDGATGVNKVTLTGANTTATVKLSGNLKAAGARPAGTYTGTFTVDASYQ